MQKRAQRGKHDVGGSMLFVVSGSSVTPWLLTLHWGLLLKLQFSHQKNVGDDTFCLSGDQMGLPCLVSDRQSTTVNALYGEGRGLVMVLSNS